MNRQINHWWTCLCLLCALLMTPKRNKVAKTIYHLQMIFFKKYHFTMLHLKMRGWIVFKTAQMVWMRVLLPSQELIHDQMPWHRILGTIQHVGNCVHKSWLSRDYSTCVKADLGGMLGTMKLFWFLEMENHKSRKIMLHYYIHCSALATIVYAQLSLYCCFVLRVHSSCNPTVLRYKYREF